MFLLAKIPESQHNEVQEALEELHQTHGIEPWWALSVFWFESNINPTSDNGVGYYGLWQLGTIAAKELKFLPASRITKLSYAEQIRLWNRYLNLPACKANGKFDNIFDLYFANIYPILMGKPDHYVFADSKENKSQLRYSRNKGLDINKDGVITVLDIKRKFIAKQPIEVQELIYRQHPELKPKVTVAAKVVKAIAPVTKKVKQTVNHLVVQSPATTMIGLQEAIPMLIEAMSPDMRHIQDWDKFFKAIGILLGFAALNDPHKWINKTSKDETR